MSKLEVNTIAPQSGTTVTLGESGDTINVASGATAGTGFGATLTGSTNNTVVTVTGANAITGESNLTWDGSNLGVGRASPETTAHIQSASGECELRLTAASTSDARLRFGDTTTTAGAYIGANRSTQNMYFRSLNSGGANMQLDSSGRLSFGADATSTPRLHYPNNDPQFVTNVGTTSDRNHYAFRNTNGHVGAIRTNNNTTHYETSSDYRLKENEVAISGGIERLKQLKPYRFNFKTDAEKTVDGFFAHEVTPVVPEAISGEKDAVDSEGNIIPQGIDQSKLVPLLTSALQEAITKIETLEAKVEALESA